MSHFTVIVFGEDVESQLAPYDEEIQVAPYFSEDDEWILKWGRKEAAKKGIENPTLEQMAEAISGEDEKYEVRDGKIGHMSTYNSNSKWDWYCVGGRWTGYFPLKPGCEGEVGDPGLMTGPAKAGYADIARLKDIDIERARNEAAKEADAAFSMWKQIYERHGKPESWASIRDSGIDINKARELYHAQPAIQKARNARLILLDCPVELFGFDHAAYVAKAVDHALVPFAFVLDGEWHECGKMGWWASVSGEMDKVKWEAFFHKTLRELDPNTLLTLVDCHI